MTKVTVKNFQSIKHVDFDINGFTVIVGRNNIGKSAVIRAVDACLNNRVGKSFIRKGTKTAEVALKRGDLDVHWKKGDKTVYTIKQGDGEAKSFTSLGRDIPQPLAEAGFGKLEIGDLKLNLQLASQLKPLFLLDEPSNITDVLASLYNLNVISTADELCQKDLKNLKSSLKERDAQLSSLQGSCEKYKDLDEIKLAAEQLVKKEASVKTLRDEIENIKRLETELSSAAAAVKRFEAITKTTIPSSAAIKKTVEEFQWLKTQEQIIFSSATAVKKLQPIHSIVLPKHELSSSLKDLNDLRKLEQQYLDAVAKVNRLCKVAELKLPDIKAAEDLKNKVMELVIIELDLQANQKAVDAASKELAILKATDFTDRMKHMSQIAAELRSLIDLENVLVPLITSTRDARDDLKATNDSLTKIKEERAQFKVCPTCKKPL